MFEHSLPVLDCPLNEWLESVPTRAAVFALFGHDAKSEPYISKTTNLRRRIHRLLSPAPAGSKRLYLGGRIARLEYSETGSPFATALLLLQATRKYGDARAQKRLHLRPPIVLRLAAENPYPRLYVTNRITQRALASTYGPFPSRAAAERFLDESLNFFLLRRCTPELDPDPAFPGCVYSEMKMCLAPCFRGCTDERYAEEAERVRQYFASRGQITLAQLEKEREEASAALNFEKAAQVHQRIEKMKSVAQQALPLVHPIAELDAVIVQPAVPQQVTAVAGPQSPEKLSNRPLQSEGDHVAIFLVRGGRIAGPAFYSVEGMRHPNERSGSTSLFAHPALLEPTPLEAPLTIAATGSNKLPRGVLEQRLQTLLDMLGKQMDESRFSMEQRSEHLSLLARWYYRPLARRVGEIFFCSGDGGGDPEHTFPLPRILRGISRVFCGQKDPAAAEAGIAETAQTPKT